MDKRRLANDMADDYEWAYDDSTVPYSAVKHGLKNFVANHRLADEAVEEQEFNQARNSSKHPHSSKVLGGATALGALLGAIMASKRVPTRKLGAGVTGGIGGALGGAALGGIGSGFMNRSFRNKNFGPERYDAYGEIADDLEEEAERLIDSKIPLSDRIHASLEAKRIHSQDMAEARKAALMAGAIMTADSLGRRYIDSNKKKASPLDMLMEKIADHSIEKTSGVATQSFDRLFKRLGNAPRKGAGIGDAYFDRVNSLPKPLNAKITDSVKRLQKRKS